MKIAASFLSMKENRMNELMISSVDYIHVDIMDGLFVKEKTREDLEIKGMLNNSLKPLDIHLMVKDVKKYIDLYRDLKPLNITFHYEAITNHLEIINYLKKIGINVGIAINPGTPVDSILSYLDMVDIVLIMSVNPGRGGQEFIKETKDKLKRLKEIRTINNFNFLIEVDGGINDQVVNNTIDSDIIVSGSYITNSLDYEKQVKILRDCLQD